jgi:hypothetical protein
MNAAGGPVHKVRHFFVAVEPIVGNGASGNDDDDAEFPDIILNEAASVLSDIIDHSSKAN